MVTESSSLCLLFSFECTRTRFKATSFIFDRVSANERLPFWIRRTHDGECFELMRDLIGRQSFLRVRLDLVGRLGRCYCYQQEKEKKSCQDLKDFS